MEALTLEAFAIAFPNRVAPDDVPALVRKGVQVWTFGYGDDPSEWTTMDPTDLWAFEGPDRDPQVVASWGPFATDGTVIDSIGRERPQF